jgi:hypothetical protein
VLEERFDTKDFENALFFHCRDHEPFFLAQGLAIEEVVEKISCGQASKEVYAPVDWGIVYRTDVDTSLWDTSSFDICRVIVAMEHKGKHVVHEDVVMFNSIQHYIVVCDGIKWVFGMFPLRRPP